MAIRYWMQQVWVPVLTLPLASSSKPRVQTGALKQPCMCGADCYAPIQAACQQSMFTLGDYCWRGDSGI